MRANNRVKKLIIALLSGEGLQLIANKRYGHFVPVFMLHRFQLQGLDLDGHTIPFLWWALEYLRGRGFNFVTVDDIANAIANEIKLPEKSICFTLDDGYWDQVEAARTFAQFDCPATYFVSSGFVDKKIWLWDSKVHYVIENASSKLLNRVRDIFPTIRTSGYSRRVLAEDMVIELMSLGLEEINRILKKLSRILEVDIPSEAPDKYRSATWRRLCQIEKMGMKVGPHTYNHPMLSRESDDDSRQEIRRSKQDLERHIASPSNVFCYPVGRRQDFGEREIEIVKSEGFSGAVSAIPGTVNTTEERMLYTMPRFGFPDNKIDFIQYATWIESFKESLRLNIR